MTTDDKEMWRINIENDTDMVCSMYGSETAESVFRRHGATCFDDLSLHATRRSSATSS